MPTTFLDLQDIVLDLMEQEDVITRDRVKRFINMAGHDVWNRYAWNERRKSALFATSVPYQEGTAQTTNGSTAVVGTGTSWQTEGIDDGWKFARKNAAPWYRVVSVADETNMVIDQTYLEGTEDAAYILYKDVLRLPEDCQTLIHMTNSAPDRGGVLSPLARVDLDALVFLPRQIGVPVQYAMEEQIGEKLTLRMWPVPDKEYRIEVHYLSKWTELVGDIEQPQLSEDKRDLLILGALKWGYMQAFESGKSQQMAGRYEHELERCWARDKRRTPLTLVLRKFDDWSAWRNPLQLPFSDQL